MYQEYALVCVWLASASPCIALQKLSQVQLICWTSLSQQSGLIQTGVSVFFSPPIELKLVWKQLTVLSLYCWNNSACIELSVVSILLFSVLFQQCEQADWHSHIPECQNSDVILPVPRGQASSQVTDQTKHRHTVLHHPPLPSNEQSRAHTLPA